MNGLVHHDIDGRSFSKISGNQTHSSSNRANLPKGGHRQHVTLWSVPLRFIHEKSRCHDPYPFQKEHKRKQLRLRPAWQKVAPAWTGIAEAAPVWTCGCEPSSCQGACPCIFRSFTLVLVDLTAAWSFFTTSCNSSGTSLVLWSAPSLAASEHW